MFSAREAREFFWIRSESDSEIRAPKIRGSQSELPPKIANWHMNGNPHVRHCGQAHWALNNVTAATDSGLLEHSPAQIRCRGA